MEFKKGDEVRIVKAYSNKDIPLIGKTFVITDASDQMMIFGTIKSRMDKNIKYWNPGELELVKRKNMKPKKVNYLLKYDLEEDPIEEFETLAQVRERIKELVEEEYALQEDSIIVYEVKSVMPIKIKKDVLIEGLDKK